MKQDYAILEWDAPKPESVLKGDLETPAPTHAATSVRVHTARYSEAEAEQAQRDPYLTLVPKLRIRGIAPEGGGVAAATATQGKPTGLTAKGQPWGLDAVGASACPYRGAGVSVAILDSGIDLTHPAFQPMTARIEARDFTGHGAGDGSGHGTHCAGTIFGQDVNGTRIGVAPDIAQAYVGRILDAKGEGDSIQMIQGMNWAIVEKRAQVLSISVAFDFSRTVYERIDAGMEINHATAMTLNDFLANMRALDALMQFAHSLENAGSLTASFAAFAGGTVVVAASGNESTRGRRLPVCPPANAFGVVSVGAARQSPQGWRIATFSNGGPSLCAPGVKIVSSIPQALGNGKLLHPLSGTSMATPHVAGVAALWFESLSKKGMPATASQVVQHMNASASQNFAAGVAWETRGAGLVQAPK